MRFRDSRQTLAVVAIATILTLSAAQAEPLGGMRLLAKRTDEIDVEVTLSNNVTTDGATVGAIRNQVELAVRQCGLTVAKTAPATMFINVTGVQQSFGPSASVLVQAGLWERVAGEFVFVDAFTEGTVISGPPGTSAAHIRSVLAELMDAFCNSILEAKADLRRAKGTARGQRNPQKR